MSPHDKIAMWRACISWNKNQMKYSPEDKPRYRANIVGLERRIEGEIAAIEGEPQ